MKKKFRQYHLFNILNTYDMHKIPLDVHVSHYFRAHPALGSKDRKFIGETLYHMVRWMGLIDHFCLSSHSWEERFHVLSSLNIQKCLEDLSLPLHIRTSFPKKIFNLLATHFGEEHAFNLCLTSNAKAPTTLRINPLKTTREAFYEKWKERFDLILTKESPFGITINETASLQGLVEFKEGLFEIQDEASQLVSQLLDARAKDHVLDFCAGSGGKTLGFAHKLNHQGQIYLHDVRTAPLLQAKKRLKRAGVENAQILFPHSPLKNTLKKKMDWIFVDVPCSGSGTLRRNPDLKWKFSEELLESLIVKQREIFKEALSYLKPKGKIVYATCSIFPEENSHQVDFFLKNYSLELVKEPFSSFPTPRGMDGFFGAVFAHVDPHRES